jgi:hypothetical protein
VIVIEKLEVVICGRVACGLDEAGGNSKSWLSDFVKDIDANEML